MADNPESEERPTVAMRPLAKVEAADSTRPTVEMAPLFKEVVEDPDYPGRIIAGYIVDGRIGAGGMGVVYAATHPLIGKRAAIKVLSRESVTDQQAVSRLLREARAVNAIGHPNIVDIFDMGLLDDGRAYIVMDLLVGETLRSLAKRNPLSLAEAVYILDACASVLIAAHEKGIIHRDLKPENIFVVVVPGRAAEVKLLDFGLAKKVATSGPATRVGTLIGTPTYVSPEQARGKADIDGRTDIYALGVMAFELLAGKVPYKRDSVFDTLSAHIEDAIPLLRDVAPDVPESLADIVAAMMAKAPGDRPALADVRTVLATLPQSAPVPEPDASVPDSELKLSSQVSSAAFDRVAETRTRPPVASSEGEPTAVTSPPVRPSRPGLPGVPAQLAHGSQPEPKPAPVSAVRPGLPGLPPPPHEFQRAPTPVPVHGAHEFPRPATPVPHEFQRPATTVPPTSHANPEPTLVEVPNLRGARPDERYFPTEAVSPLSSKGGESYVDTQPVPKQGAGLSWRSMLTIVVVATFVLILIALL